MQHSLRCLKDNKDADKNGLFSPPYGRLFQRDDELASAYLPPISFYDPENEAFGRVHTTSRWLAAVVLCGLCGLALLSSTLYLALDRKSFFAIKPEYVSLPHETETGAERVNPGKGNRLVLPVDIVTDKRDFEVSEPIKIGDKEITRAHPFTLVSTLLTTTPTQFANAVPALDTLTANNDKDLRGSASADLLVSEGEGVFTSRNINAEDMASISGDLSLPQVLAQIEDYVQNEHVGSPSPLKAAQMMLMHTNYLQTKDKATAHMVEENVTSIPRTTINPSASGRLLRSKQGASLEHWLRENGAAEADVSAILSAFGYQRGGSMLAEGQKVVFRYSDPQDPLLGYRIARVEIYADDKLSAAVALNDEGHFVKITRGSLPAPPATPQEQDEDTDLSLYQSLYQTALKQGLPEVAIRDFVNVFTNDVDFQSAVRTGDLMIALVAKADKFDPHPMLLYAALTVRDQTFHYYRFHNPEDEKTDFYDESGRSRRTFLLRKPIVEGEMTSPFGMRYHPILHYARMHTGVDWAAPIGTPILAAGNGVIIKSGWDSGYGRRIEIQHANGYVTTYNHMSAFGRGMNEGAHVRQGHVIGYLGQSGLATGPHLHYEVIINNNFVDPMAIKLSRTREFDGHTLSLFKKERARIDGLMSEAPRTLSGM